MSMGDLVIRLSADMAEFRNDMGRAVATTENAVGRIDSLTGDLSKKVRNSLAGIAAGFSVISIADSVRKAVSDLAALDDAAAKTGASVEKLSAAFRVAKISGIDTSLVESSLINLSKTIAAAGDSGSEAAKGLRALGLSQKELAGMDTVDALKLVADRMNQYADGSGKTALALTILKKSGAEALPYMQDLADEVELVGTATTESAAQAERFEKSIAALSVSIGSVSKGIAQEAMPFLIEFTDSLRTADGEANEFGRTLGVGVTETLRALIILGGNVAFTFKGVGNTLGGIAAQLAALGRGDFAGFSAINDAIIEEDQRARKAFDAWEARMLTAGTTRAAPAQAATPDKPKIDYLAPDESALRDAKAAAKERLAILEAGLQAEIAAVKAGEKDKLDIIAAAQKLGTLTIEQAGNARVQSIAESVSEEVADLLKIANARKAAGDQKGYIETEAKIAEAVRRVATASREAAQAVEEYLNKQKEMESQAWDKVVQASWDSADAIEKQADSLEQQAANFGLSEEAIYRNLAAQVALDAQQQKSLGYDPQIVASLEAKAAAYERMADGAAALAGKKTAQEEADKAAQAWKDFSRDIEQSLTDSLYRAFESGESFGDAFAKNLEATFKTMVLKATIQSVVSPVMGSLGLSGLAGGAAGSGGMLSSLFAGTAMGTMGAEFAAGFSSTLPADVAGPTMAGAGGAAGFGASVSTAMPYIAAAAAAYYVAEKYTKGETRSGQEYILGAKGIEVDSRRGGGSISEDALTALSNAAIKTTNNLLDRYADTQIATFRSKLETSGKGRGGVFAGGTLDSGASFGEFRFESTTSRSLDGEEAQAAYALDLMQSTLQALRAADIGGEIGELLASTMQSRVEEVFHADGYTYENLSEVFVPAYTEVITSSFDQIEALTAQQAGALIAAFDAGLVDDLLENFGDVSPTLEQVAEAAGKLMAVQPLAGLFDALGVSLVKFGPAVAEALGGVDAAGAALGTYFANFYTEGEQASARASALSSAWANDLNLMGEAMPTTAAGFRDLVEGLDLADEAQLKTYASLMSISGAFSEVFGSAQSAADATQTAADNARDLADANTELANSYNQIKTNSATRFMSSDESFSYRSGQAITELNAAGLNLPSLDGAGYRALYEQQDATTQTGRDNIDLLERWADTFGEWLERVADTATATQTALDDATTLAADTLRTSIETATNTRAAFANKYSELLTADQAAAQIASAGVGIDLPELLGLTPAALRALASSTMAELDPATEAGRTMIETLAGLSPAFDVLVNSAEAFGNAATQAANDLQAAISRANSAQANAVARYSPKQTAEDAVKQINAAGLGYEIRAEDALAMTPEALRANAAAEFASVDTSTEAGRQRLETLTGLTGAIDTLINASAGLREAEAAAARDRAQAQQTAASSARQAADNAAREQQRAQEQIREGWKRTADSIIDTMAKLRGELLGNGAKGFAATQADFAITTAAARAGDQEAANKLPALASAVVELGKNVTASAIDQAILTAQTLASLRATVAGMAKFGVTVPAFDVGTNYVTGDMVAKVHKGERIMPAADNAALMRRLGNGDETATLLKSVLAELTAIKATTGAGATHTATTARTLQRLIPDGDALSVRVAA